jgi:hypothetical protein
MTLIAMLIAAAAASSQPASALRTQTEDRVRAELSDLIRSLCPEQCVLLSVRAGIEEQVVTGADLQPGFQALSQAVKTLGVRSAGATVLLDKALPQAFRSRFKQLAAARLAGMAAQVSVDEQTVMFPPRNAPHLEAPEKPPAPPPAVAKEPPAPPPQPASVRIEEKLIEHAPVLVLALLFSAVVLVLGVLSLLAIRTVKQPQEVMYQEEPAAQAAPAVPQDAFSTARLRKLEKALATERVLRNQLMREALARGEVRLVAAWVRELGEVLLEDLRGDAALSGALALLGTEVSNPDISAQAPRALRELEGRLLSLRLRNADDSTARTFDFIHGIPAERFSAACAGLSQDSLEIVLRFAPPHLRAQALSVLEPSRRQELALGWAGNPEVSTSAALTSAEELRQRLDELGAGVDQRNSALSDLLDSMARAEQDELIARMHETEPRAADGFLTESTLLGASPDVLSSAVLSLPQQSVLQYLSAAERPLREAVLGACPTRLRAELHEELSTRAAASRPEFLAARRQLIGRVHEESLRGHGPAEPPKRVAIARG